MDRLLKQEIAGIINKIQRGDAPPYSGDEGDMLTQNTSLHTFGIVDTKVNRQIITDPESGAARYINGNEDDTYSLKFICYDEYLHRFVYDDGEGNLKKSRLPNREKMADYIVIDTSEDKQYIIIHELCEGDVANKRNKGKKQLSATINLLYKSVEVGNYIDSFKNKICYLSAKDGRDVKTNGLADGFMDAYLILPEPQPFNFGQIGTKKFKAFESSIVKLDK